MIPGGTAAASRIAHLSDTHFGTELPQVAETLLACLTALRPDLVVVSGDVTQRARRGEFAAASAWFKRLPAPVLVLPGNHDIPLFDLLARVFGPYRNFRRAFGARSGVWRGRRAAVLGLDTTLASRHTRGRLDTAQFSQLAATAAPAADAVLVAAVHQPLHAVEAQDRSEVLLNAAEAAALFARQKVDLVLSGHVHVPVITTTRKIFPQLPRHFILAGAGTAMSHRTRAGAPNSFNLLCCGNEVEVLPFHFDDAIGTFRQKSRFAFRLREDGWDQTSS